MPYVEAATFPDAFEGASRLTPFRQMLRIANNLQRG